MSAHDYRKSCFSNMVALKYAMAGDMESVQLLDQLEERRCAIQWDDSAFIQMSEQMRAPLPNVSPMQESEIRPTLMALIHLQMERIAEANEGFSCLKQLAKGILAQQEQVKATTVDLLGLHNKLFAIAEKAIEVNGKMRNKLEMLGADVTEYEIPPELFT